MAFSDEKIKKEKNKNVEGITLYPGMAGMTRDIVEKMKAQGVELLSVDIMVTQKCNFRCSYCYAEGGPDKIHQLSMKEAKKIVDNCIELGVRIINMQGGEPLIWSPSDFDKPQPEPFFHLIKYIRSQYEKAHLPIDIVSFTDVAPINSREKAQRLLDLGLALCCKLDSMDEAIQDGLLRTQGGFKSMMKGFDNLISVGYGKENMPSVSTNTVVTADNYVGVKEVFRWSRSKGFRPFVIPVHVHGRAKEYNDTMLSSRKTSKSKNLTSSDIKNLFIELSNIDAQEFDIHWEPKSPWVENKACSRHLGGVHVRADGIVVPCSEAPNEWALGDIRKQDFKEIARSEKVKKFRNIYSELHTGSKCHPSNCQMSAERKCYGCRTRSYDDSAYDADGNYKPENLDPEAFFSGDPACWVCADK